VERPDLPRVLCQEYWEHLLSEVRLQRSRSVVTDTHISLLQKQLQVLSTLRAELRRQALLRPPRPEQADRRPAPIESLPEMLDKDKDGMEMDEQMQLQDEAHIHSLSYTQTLDIMNIHTHTYIHSYLVCVGA
jgi:hypothetical protein